MMFVWVSVSVVLRPAIPGYVVFTTFLSRFLRRFLLRPPKTFFTAFLTRFYRVFLNQALLGIENGYNCRSLGFALEDPRYSQEYLNHVIFASPEEVVLTAPDGSLGASERTAE
jgi:hypothetical protein